MTRKEMKARNSEPRRIRLYDPVEIAPLLSAKKPFFRMTSGVCAVELRKNSKGEEVPVSFRRIDKDRTLKGKHRKRAKVEMRRRVKNAERFNQQAMG